MLSRPQKPPQPQQCDICHGPVYQLHCKIICKNCGYTRDCSDL